MAISVTEYVSHLNWIQKLPKKQFFMQNEKFEAKKIKSSTKETF